MDVCECVYVWMCVDFVCDECVWMRVSVCVCMCVSV